MQGRRRAAPRYTKGLQLTSGPKIYTTPGATETKLDGLSNFAAVGGDWGEISGEAARMARERIVINLGPAHPSAHGIYHLPLGPDGEYVREIRGATGFLRIGIEKNMGYRTWTQGITYVTRMDYVASFFREVGYCMAVRKLLGIEEQIPRRTNVVRMLLMELQHIASRLVATGSSLNELGATTMMTIVFRTREDILRIFERISGLRMNYEFVRSRGVLEDVPEGIAAYIRELLPDVRGGTSEMETVVAQNPIFKARFEDVGAPSLSALMVLGQTEPTVRATGLPWDLHKSQPYCGYEGYEFEVPVYDKSDAYNRAMVHFDECYQSLRIVYQTLDRLGTTEGEPVIVEDKKIAQPAHLSISTDGQGTAPAHMHEIMTKSMESLIHHFKLVTEGSRVPADQAYSVVEHAKGVLGRHLVSSERTRSYRAHVSNPGFRNLQDLSMTAEGGTPADTIVCPTAIDPVMGDVDR